MIRKLLSKDIRFLLFLMIMPGYLTLAQNSFRSDTVFNTEKVASEDSRTQDVIVSWDFTQVNNRRELSELILEVQPLNNCWKELDGTNRSEKLTFQVNDFSETQQGSLRFTHYQLKSKCFKWRAKINHNSEIVYTEWLFSSFL